MDGDYFPKQFFFHTDAVFPRRLELHFLIHTLVRKMCIRTLKCQTTLKGNTAST